MERHGVESAYILEGFGDCPSKADIHKLKNEMHAQLESKVDKGKLEGKVDKGEWSEGRSWVDEAMLDCIARMNAMFSILESEVDTTDLVEWSPQGTVGSEAANSVAALNF